MEMRRELPPLRLLTTFEAVLRTGGVQNAAAELNVTQPAVSQALKSLEDHVGTKLLDRRIRPANLTEAGQILFRAVSNGLDQIGRAIDQIKAMERVEQNVVTVACTICTGTYWLMPRLAAFYSLYPDMTVRVVTSSGIPRFATDTDLIIRYGSGDWSDGESELLFRERLVPVCSPQAIARFGAGNLEKAILLHVEAEDDCWPDWNDYFEAVGLSGSRQGDRTFSNYVQATQAAIAGIGVMLGWVSNTGDLVREGRLAVFRDQPIFPDGAFYLVSPRRGRVKAASALLASHLRGCAAGS
jgi:DNA-binding transcriptional LysR family regulator